MPASISQSVILFILMATGFAAARMGVFNGDSKKSLSRLLVDFTLPALIIVSMQKPFTPDLRDQALRVLALSTVVYALSFPLAFLLTSPYKKASPKEKGVHRFAVCFSNVGFMGFPIAQAILGKDSLFMVSVYNIPFQVLAFSAGILLITGNQAAGRKGRRDPDSAPSAKGFVKSVLKLANPAIISALLGFALFIFSIKIPSLLFTSMQLLGDTTTPLAMVLIGANLAATRLGSLFGNRRLWTTSAFRLALLPALVYLLAKAAGLQGLELSVPVLIAAMPVAANSSILATVYDGDADTASALVFLSTVLSLISIPLVGTFLTGS